MADERDRDLPEFALDALAEAPELATALALVGADAGTAPLPEALRARLMASASSAKDRFAPFEKRLAELFDVATERVGELFASLSDAGRWEPGPLPGSMLFHLDGGPRVATADVGFVRLPAGLEFPEHRHLGAERVLLLEGSYRDSDGTLWRAGDLHEMPAGSSHAFTVDADSSVLLATVLDGGIDIANIGVVSGKQS